MLKNNKISLRFPLKIIPEWELPASLGLISPNDLLLPRDELIPFYRYLLGFLSKISEISKITLFSKNSNDEIFKSNQSDKLKSVNIKQIDYLSDIWIRDFAPIRAMDADGNKCMELKK